MSIWASRELGLEELLYRVDAENLSSRNIVEKLGGVLSKEWQEVNKHQEMAHMLCYRLRAPIAQTMPDD